jgi:hypothetical protein
MMPRNKIFNFLPDREFFAGLCLNFAVLLGASIVILVIRHDGSGVWSLTLGATVSAVNFWLLSTSIPKLLRPDLEMAPNPRTGRIVRRALFEFVGRYVVLGAAVYFAIRSRTVHLVAFAMGLSLPIFAIMIQGVRMTFSAGRIKSA